MIYTIAYILRNDEDTNLDVKEVRVEASDATRALSKALKEIDKQKSDVKVLEIRLGF